MGQLHAGDHIADGINIFPVGAEMLIHQNGALFVLLHRKSRAEQVFGVGAASGGQQHAVAFHALIFFPVQIPALKLAFGGLGDLLQPGLVDKFHPPLFQHHGQVLGQLLVHLGQDPVPGRHQGHFLAIGVIEGSKLHADDPGSGHDQVVIKGVHAQQFIAGDDSRQIHPFHRRAGRYAACGDENVLCVKGFLFAPIQGRKGNGVLIQDGAGAPEMGNAIALEQLFHAAPQLAHHFFLPGLDLGRVQRHMIGMQTQGFKVMYRFMIELGGMEHGFGGDTAPIEAGASHIPVFNDGGLEPQLSRPDSGHIASRPGADDHQLILLIHLAFLPFSQR